jgi:hypothetical protein
LAATYAHNTIIAWAKGRSEGDEFYLSIWRDAKSLEKARQDEESGKNPPYDFVNDPQSMDYSHVYPPAETAAPEPAVKLTAALDTTVLQEGVHRYMPNAGTVLQGAFLR